MLNILTNTSSMMAARALNKNQQALAQSFQRLSTGLRINSSKDDAAGLGVANRLESQLRGLNQAARNASDTVSMLQTADSAFAEQQTMLQRLRELAVQAASDTQTAETRAAIQSEADALVSEIDRIALQTSFNGRNLLDGSINNLSFQVGAFQDQSVSISIASSRASNLGSVYGGTFTVTSGAAALANDLTLNGISAANLAADGVSTSDADGSAIAKATAINATTHLHGVTATVESNVQTGGSGIVTAAADLVFAINGVNVSIAQADRTADDANGAVVAAINAVASTTGVTAERIVNGAGAYRLQLTAVDGRNIHLVNSTGDVANLGFTTGTTYYGDITIKSDSQIVVAGGDEDHFGLTAGTISAPSTTNVSNLNLTSQSGATTAIETIDDAITQSSRRQAAVGALLSRMDSAVSNLAAAAENIAAARSRILETDFAAETAEFSKQQILQQAATSMLAQANVRSQVVLSLLG